MFTCMRYEMTMREYQIVTITIITIIIKIEIDISSYKNQQNINGFVRAPAKLDLYIFCVALKHRFL